MEKYTEKLDAIASQCKNDIDTQQDILAKKIDDLSVFNEKEQRKGAERAKEEYRSACSAIRSRAIEQEGELFDRAGSELEKVMAQAPTADQLAYLQTLSLRSDIKDSDIELAAIAMEGNALAESALRDIAKKNGADIPQSISSPDLVRLRDGLRVLQRQHENAITQYKVTPSPITRANVYEIAFAGMDNQALANVDDAIERYSA